MQISGPSLRGRVTLWTTLVTLLIQLLLGTLVFLFQRHHSDTLFSSRLAMRAGMVKDGLKAAAVPINDDVLRRLVRDPLESNQPDRFNVFLYSPRGEVIASTRRPPPHFEVFQDLSPLPDGLGHAGRRKLKMFSGETGPARMSRIVLQRVQPEDGDSPTLVVVRSDDAFEQMMAIVAQTLAFAMVLCVVATATATWLITGILLSPLRELATVARAFDVDTVRTREPDARTINLNMPSELDDFQRELSAAQGRLKTMLREQERLISNLSHEVKTPIAVLLTQGQTLDTATLGPDQKEFVASVRQEMLKLAATVEVFVRLSQVKTGADNLKLEVVDVHEPILKAVRVCSALAEKRNVNIIVTASEADETPFVNCDPELLAGMFTHLLKNSIRMSDRGGEVRVEVSTSAGEFQVLIADRGPSVPESFLGRLFDQFTASSSECGDRQDLGLSIAQGIAELHGGAISATNGAKGGCEFLVRLPCRDQNDL